jgi:hypothetical protein
MATRMMISYLMQDSVLEETGFGIYAVNGPNYDLGEFTVVVDMTNQTIYEVGSNVQVKWEDFVQAYNPKVYAEASAVEGSLRRIVRRGRNLWWGCAPHTFLIQWKDENAWA